MRILDGGLVGYACPLVETYRTATATHDVRRGLLVHVATDGGVLGLGETAPLSNRTESLDEARRALEAALQRLGDEEWTLEEAVDGLDELVAPEARAARFGLSLALEDAIAQAGEAPLAEHLAAHRLDDRQPLTSVPVNATIPDASIETTRERARRAADRGVDVAKIKAGRGDPERDRERIQAVRDEAPELRLRVDLNEAFPTVDGARRFVERLPADAIEYVEQPLPADDLEAMARLRNETDVAIAADEPARDPRSARATVLARACDVLVVKPMVLGGVDRALKVAELADREAVDVVVTTTIDAAVARAGTLHVAAALGRDERAHGLATGWLLADEPASFDERVEAGRLLVPDAPGHGARRESGETKLRHREGP